MNYIDIKEASEATGKSEKTIRRLINKTESNAFVDKSNSKIIIDVNYLFSVYPPVKKGGNKVRQSLDIGDKVSGQIELINLKNKLEIYEQELKHKETLLNEKDNRILDLQKAMLLLEAHKGQQPIIKKRWWKF